MFVCVCIYYRGSNGTKHGCVGQNVTIIASGLTIVGRLLSLIGPPSRRLPCSLPSQTWQIRGLKPCLISHMYVISSLSKTILIIGITFMDLQRWRAFQSLISSHLRQIRYPASSFLVMMRPSHAAPMRSPEIHRTNPASKGFPP